MSYSIKNTTVGTPIPGAVEKTVPVMTVNFDKDFRVLSKKDNELSITNVQSPLVHPRSYRFGCKNIANIFNNSPVAKTPGCPSQVGTQILVGFNDTISIADELTGKYYSYPIRSHVIITVPNDPLVTPEIVMQHIQSLIAGLFEQQDTSNKRVNALLHGILLPAVLDD